MEAAKVSKRDVSAVYAVDLSQRPVPQGDAAREKAALLQLARRMHDAPAEMLPRFVELAMELTGGISAGISLLEETEPSPVFRWHHLKGILSPFNGATTPRDFSPCGITLDRSAPTLTIHPERVYDWIPPGLFLPEVLLVPLYISITMLNSSARLEAAPWASLKEGLTKECAAASCSRGGYLCPPVFTPSDAKVVVIDLPDNVHPASVVA